ncbi:MAG: hypothetical protein CMI15_14880 [Opitutaceae bacterium]|nr:hypothetical protein [Opitutaceae bacterium]|tara:strand:- start:263 stop:904 length:642 start_codon:yes stop_codon:yes gene_type:complete
MIKITKPITVIFLISCLPSGVSQVGENSNVLNPNLATEEELMALKGMTPAIVKSIFEARPISSNLNTEKIIERYLSLEARDNLRTKLFLPINLNTVSDEELGLVPGISRKIKHEFEEYRPYVSINQFRREIGKYVDNKEVVRFEQYVFVPMDLNSASSNAFMSIPGISRKMVHEFEEYRPYNSIQEFRSEIGKYVSDREVSRLERYIFIEDPN